MARFPGDKGGNLPGAKATSGTRRGNGAGYGGSANGGGGRPAEEFKVGNDAATRVRPDREAMKAWREQKEWEHLCNLDAIAQDEDHPAAARVSASDKFLDRVSGKAVATVHLSGADGGPLQAVSITTNDPIEAAKVYQRLMGGG